MRLKAHLQDLEGASAGAGKGPLEDDYWSRGRFEEMAGAILVLLWEQTSTVGLFFDNMRNNISKELCLS